MKPLLSILIRTIVGREEKFNALWWKLEHQRYLLIKLYGEDNVEMLFEKDNKEISVGAKAQKLIERASGMFVCFIDDDDDVPEYYISKILSAIKNNIDLDCIGFRIECKGTAGKTASASNKWDDWADNVGGFDYGFKKEKNIPPL